MLKLIAYPPGLSPIRSKSASQPESVRESLVRSAVALVDAGAKEDGSGTKQVLQKAAATLMFPLLVRATVAACATLEQSN